jgi:protein-S-isoprenylcysteine O-methyltransferase Ste14
MNPQTGHNTPPRVGSMQWWQRIARRIRVPLGFVTAAVFLVTVARHAPSTAAILWSLALVLPGIALRAIASGTVKKNRELTVTGPYAYTRNPLYLGSMLIAAGFALAALSWPLALLLAFGFAIIYIPVIASEEKFLRSAFPEFDSYCRGVPRLIPRLTPAKLAAVQDLPVSQPVTPDTTHAFSFALYLQHREYNAALGAVLLYLSLLLLHPVLQHFLRGAR